MALKVLVTYTMKPGHRAAFLTDTAAIRPQILAEAGCQQYDYYASAEDENKALLVEQWIDREAQQVHLTQPHMAGIRQAKEDHVIDTALELFDI
jgi:quinol monooxygenase YgiN